MRFVSAVLLLSFATSMQAVAQDGATTSSSVSASPTSTTQTSLQSVKDSEKTHHFLFGTDLTMAGLGADFQFRLGDKFSVGPTLAFLSDSSGVYSGTEVSDPLYGTAMTNRQTYGVRAVYYLRGMESWTPYISAAGTYSQNQVTLQTDTFSNGGSQAKFNETDYMLMGGYQFVWLRMLTLRVGGGVGSYNHPGSITWTNASGTTTTAALQSSSVSYALDLAFGLQF